MKLQPNTILGFAFTLLAILTLSPAWPNYVEFVLQALLLPAGVAKLAVWPATFIVTVAVFSPFAAIGYALGRYIRRRRSTSELDQSRRTVENISSAIDTLQLASDRLLQLKVQLDTKAGEVASLQSEIRALQSIRDEEHTLVQEKLKIINQRGMWPLVLSHLLAVVIGVAGNVMSDILKLQGLWPL